MWIHRHNAGGLFSVYPLKRCSICVFRSCYNIQQTLMRNSIILAGYICWRHVNMSTCSSRFRGSVLSAVDTGFKVTSIMSLFKMQTFSKVLCKSSYHHTARTVCLMPITKGFTSTHYLSTQTNSYDDHSLLIFSASLGWPLLVPICLKPHIRFFTLSLIRNRSAARGNS